MKILTKIDFDKPNWRLAGKQNPPHEHGNEVINYSDANARFKIKESHPNSRQPNDGELISD